MAGRILKVPPKLAAGSRQNSQAGGLRYIAQPSRLRVRGASQPHVPSHRQPTDGGCNKMRLLRRLHDSKPGKMRLGPDAWRRKVESMSPMEKQFPVGRSGFAISRRESGAMKLRVQVAFSSLAVIVLVMVLLLGERSAGSLDVRQERILIKETPDQVIPVLSKA